MQPFELEDESKPGQCTIASLLLVDPNRRIPSASDVSPQQEAWHDSASGLPTLFNSAVKEVIDRKRDFPVTFASAQELRQQQLQERKRISDMGNS